jgi:hypothetical protein
LCFVVVPDDPDAGKAIKAGEALYYAVLGSAMDPADIHWFAGDTPASLEDVYRGVTEGLYHLPAENLDAVVRRALYGASADPVALPGRFCEDVWQAEGPAVFIVARTALGHLLRRAGAEESTTSPHGVYVFDVTSDKELELVPMSSSG